jgi:hypothetical protein
MTFGKKATTISNYKARPENRHTILQTVSPSECEVDILVQFGGNFW